VDALMIAAFVLFQNSMAGAFGKRNLTRLYRILKK
jgi:hypothetical protein